MKKIALLVSFTVFIITGCSQKKATDAGKDASKPIQDMQPPQDLKTVNITTDKLAIIDDPICGMSMKETPIADTAIYNNGVYGFCNSGCKREFKQDPKGVLANYQKSKQKK